MERLFLALDDGALPSAPTPHVFLASLGDEAQRGVFRAVHDLRRAGLRVATDVKGRSLKAQMKEANRQDAPYTLIVGDREMDEGKAQVKTMATGEQTEVAFDRLAAYLKGAVGLSEEQAPAHAE
jgi:histidyl-tRNA synthetase